jgi:uncharacterized DUF497 family protein
VKWTWSNEKNRTNRRDHELSFETAGRVFDDPLALSREDPHPEGERWQTVRLVGTVVLFVVHTWPESDATTGEESGRVISAQKGDIP